MPPRKGTSTSAPSEMLDRLKTPTATVGSASVNPARAPSSSTSTNGGSLNPSSGIRSWIVCDEAEDPEELDRLEQGVDLGLPGRAGLEVEVVEAQAHQRLAGEQQQRDVADLGGHRDRRWAGRHRRGPRRGARAPRRACRRGSRGTGSVLHPVGAHRRAPVVVEAALELARVLQQSLDETEVVGDLLDIARAVGDDVGQSEQLLPHLRGGDVRGEAAEVGPPAGRGRRRRRGPQRRRVRPGGRRPRSARRRRTRPRRRPSSTNTCAPALQPGGSVPGEGRRRADVGSQAATRPRVSLTIWGAWSRPTRTAVPARSSSSSGIRPKSLGRTPARKCGRRRTSPAATPAGSPTGPPSRERPRTGRLGRQEPAGLVAAGARTAPNSTVRRRAGDRIRAARVVDRERPDLPRAGARGPSAR